MTDYEALMQPGDDAPSGLAWKDEALCHGDDAFTGERPDEELADDLGRVCSLCDVFAECLAEHRFSDVGGVWAAGEWRDHPNEEDNQIDDLLWLLEKNNECI